MPSESSAFAALFAPPWACGPSQPACPVKGTVYAPMFLGLLLTRAYTAHSLNYNEPVAAAYRMFQPRVHQAAPEAPWIRRFPAPPCMPELVVSRAFLGPHGLSRGLAEEVLGPAWRPLEPSSVPCDGVAGRRGAILDVKLDFQGKALGSCEGQSDAAREAASLRGAILEADAPRALANLCCLLLMRALCGGRDNLGFHAWRGTEVGGSWTGACEIYDSFLRTAISAPPPGGAAGAACRQGDC